MAGSKPSHKALAKSKDAPKGTKGTPVLAGWPNNFGAVNIKLEKGWRLIGPDGQEITSDSHWITLYANEERKELPPLPPLMEQNRFDDDQLPF